ncbi:3-dehydroquinate synthase [Cnuella takakiae]|uniref:3-dehydroquinate synthase n=1 Tax=Cnuella takakiae TaxID=1302690 RepID=A0A1M4WW09_9BACT|nr:3-dehydroquinate synthase [Cnuella takakiae]OLY91603.1 3-dehydroquinate synthase [Cnuella takakiae]SHE85385.1 3-dehydroquinate synthase [Cnuella takakiae]
MTEFLQQTFQVRFEYKVAFTEHLFAPSNPAFRDFLGAQKSAVARKLLFVLDKGVVAAHPELQQQIRDYADAIEGYKLVPEMMVIEGGEGAKNDIALFDSIVEAVNAYGIDRHSYIVAIGGGSLLDLVGYAAAVSHRGIRLIRIPTTVLSQNDSGIGVKNGINWFGKKNFLGTFAPPVAVFNDYHFLTTLSDADWRSGMSEAVKVALIKDAPFFEWMEANAAKLAKRDMPAMQYLVKRCAELHMQHIAGGDPFEMGSSRPLDFGHWSAHKLETLTNFSIRHGEAVAMGIALDSAYSLVSGRLDEESYHRIIALLQNLGFAITHPLMEINDEHSSVIAGLNEFREHLGGRLTIMLLVAIGKGEEVHELDNGLLQQASALLQQAVAA